MHQENDNELTVLEWMNIPDLFKKIEFKSFMNHVKIVLYILLDSGAEHCDTKRVCENMVGWPDWLLSLCVGEIQCENRILN